MIERIVSTFPLVAKELEEQAARKRTYQSRIAMGVILFGAFASVYLDVIGTQFDQLTVLGQGGRLFDALLLVLLSYVCFIVPGYSSASVNSERRNGSLQLLRLTPLGPTSIVVQKFVGRLVPVLCNLMIGVPVLVITYAFGGVEFDDLVVASVALVATALVLSAIALDLSAAFDSPEAAFGGTILLAGALAAAVFALTKWWPPAAPWAFGLAPPLALAYGAGSGPLSWLVVSLAFG
ncbi:MAG: ABC transporter permease, partial [Planctomycetota bacterium]